MYIYIFKHLGDKFGGLDIFRNNYLDKSLLNHKKSLFKLNKKKPKNYKLFGFLTLSKIILTYI
ncbi:MAG: hypothetical protein K1060chlam5_00205 [Candidatus Anoxychlamydiales bacterium]|nr:hypothetical protein [Candidatus Anoxychlamydiales bacterium]